MKAHQCGRINTGILVCLSRLIHLRANTKPTASTGYLMQSAFKHELHNVELTTLRYHIPLLFQLHLGMSTASLKCCGREMPHPTPDPCVHPIHSPSNAAQSFRASHTQRSFCTHIFCGAGIPHLLLAPGLLSDPNCRPGSDHLPVYLTERSYA